MDRLKRFLAIPMAASAVAALWLLYRLSGERALLFGLFAVSALAVCLYLAGHMQRTGRSRANLALGLALVVVAAGVLRMPATAVSRASPAGAGAWSEERVAALQQQGKPMVVYITADWCLTCKVNETVAIDRAEVRNAFRQADVTLLAGDWTNGDPAITRFLESRGRAGVPLYLWYAPGKPPEELPQVLTPAMLIARAQAVKR
jgi:thiol:disulfide interchange protein